MEDENHQYDLIIEGPLTKMKKLYNTSGHVLKKVDSIGGFQLNWNNVLKLNNLTFGCITEVELLDKYGSVLRKTR